MATYVTHTVFSIPLTRFLLFLFVVPLLSMSWLPAPLHSLCSLLFFAPFLSSSYTLIFSLTLDGLRVSDHDLFQAGPLTRPGSLAFTSDLSRAQQTLSIILKEIGQEGIETKKDLALNERDYGELTGLNKDDARKKWGEDQVCRADHGLTALTLHLRFTSGAAPTTFLLRAVSRWN